MIKFSDEQLHAFIDDEIDIHDRAEIMEAVRNDEVLAVRVCELLQVKDSVRLAYREPPQPAHTRSRWQSSRKTALSVNLAAAILLFALGGLSGWVLNIWTEHAALAPSQSITRIAPKKEERKRVVFHIGTADPARIEQALDDAELLLSSYRDKPELVQLEVIANAQGLSLLRKDASPYVERIRRMAHEYDNVDFLACSRTIEKLRLKGITVHLVPEAQIIPGALEEIVDRLQEGWIYIRV